jgi:hypothetical protein
VKVRLYRILVFILVFVIMFPFIGTQFLSADEPSPPSEQGRPEARKDVPKTKEERLRELRLEEAEITLKQMRFTMEEKERDHKSMETLFEQGLVSVQEMNDAKKDMEEATLAYETAKLQLQRAELELLKAAWHITIREAEVIDKGDKKLIIITLANTSEKVKLERTQKMIQEGIIEPVDIEVNPEINDIYVSIKEGESIISDPYELYIPSLKLGEPELLTFELIKDVEDVVVSMRYEEQEDRRNIHLRKVEPYISVVKAIKYKTVDDRRMIYVVLRNGAVEREGEHVESATEAGLAAAGSESNPGRGSPSIDIELPDYIEAEDHAVNDINNIYASIKDEQMNIIGIPYEIRIPILKYNEQKGYRFELQKDVSSVVVSMTYLKTENSKRVYLEPDTRHISILSAQVRKLPNEKKEVTLELVNRSESGEIPFAEELDEISDGSAAATSEIRNVFVSLKHGGVVIARPYETVIDRLEYEKPTTLKFELQQPDVEDVTVSLSYLDRTEEKNVYLEKVSPPDVVTVRSGSFAQEGQLGRSIRYDLSLERLAEVERVFRLRVIDLLDQLTYRFNDPQAGTRVTQIRFTGPQSKRDLSLEIFLPEEIDYNLLDKELDFYAAILSEEEDAKYQSGTDGRLTLSQDELNQLKGGKVRLVLTPKGVPEFELMAQNLYFEIKTGETVEMLLTLKNIGTRNLENIRITTDLPSNKWNSDIQPELVKKLDRQEEKEINIVIFPPVDVGVGDSEVKINAETEVDNVPVEAPEKNVRIHISGRTNIMGSVILIGALILLVIGIAVLTIRLSRR